MSGRINMDKKIKRAEDLNKRIGEVFGTLEVVEFYPIRPQSETRYESMKNIPWCRCVCISKEHNNPQICYYPWYIVSTRIVSSCGCLAAANYRKAKEERTTRLTYQDKTMTIEEWAKELKVSIRCIRYRMKMGKPIEEVLMPRKENPYDTNAQSVNRL